MKAYRNVEAWRAREASDRSGGASVNQELSSSMVDMFGGSEESSRRRASRKLTDAMMESFERLGALVMKR